MYTPVNLLLLLEAELSLEPVSGPHLPVVGGVAPGVAPEATFRDRFRSSIVG
jgi:hypothetical protein